ncbi:MAG: hypothetical protein H6709_18250 [Kofleriaceae bacterium]|nr:hypothetical protein [Kofleriaceae bacterium]MCB9574028.1 hypothetical protein [Kofleriaceae bacterium]
MTRATWVGVVLVVAAATGCGNEARRAGPSCAERADRLGAALRGLADQVRVFGPGVAVAPPELPHGRPLSRAAAGPVQLTLEVGRDGTVTIRGTSLGADRDALRERLAAEAARAGVDPDAPSTPTLYVVADAATTLAALDDVVAAVPEAFELRLVGVGPEPSLSPYLTELRDLPAAKKVRDDIEHADPSLRATRVASHMQDVVGSCAPLIRIFGGVAATEEDKATYMAREVPGALRACSCKVGDPDVVEYLLLEVFDAYQRPQRWLPLARAHADAAAGATVATLATGG